MIKNKQRTMGWTIYVKRIVEICVTLLNFELKKNMKWSSVDATCKQKLRNIFVTFLYFCNFVTKIDQKPKTKYRINDTFEMNCRNLCDTVEFWTMWTLKKTKEEKNMKWSFMPWWTQNDTATKCVFNFISSFLGGNLTFKRFCQKDTALAKETCFSSRKSCLKK